MKKTGIFLLIVLFASLSDIFSKNYIESHYEIHTSTPILGDFLRFSPVYNTGSVFGGFQGNPRFFHVLQGMGILALLFYFIKYEQKNSKTMTAFSMLIGGAIGNFTDKFFRPGVLDFIDMGIGDFRWYVYNIADIFIFFAILILILYYFKKEPAAKITG